MLALCLEFGDPDFHFKPLVELLMQFPNLQSLVLGSKSDGWDLRIPRLQMPTLECLNLFQEDLTAMLGAYAGTVREVYLRGVIIDLGS